MPEPVASFCCFTGQYHCFSALNGPKHEAECDRSLSACTIYFGPCTVDGTYHKLIRLTRRTGCAEYQSAGGNVCRTTSESWRCRACSHKLVSLGLNAGMNGGGRAIAFP